MTSVIAGSIESWSRNDWGLSQGALTPRAWRVNGTDRPRTVAGYPGFYNLLEAISDPGHEEHDELLDWLGTDRPRTVAGYPGFYNLLEAISDPGHEEHDELLDWLGDGFDPEAFSVDEVNRRLAPLQRRRNKAAAGKK